MKNLKLLQAVLVISNLICITSCGTNNPASSVSPSTSGDPVVSENEADKLVFANKTVTYDGTSHSVLIENLPSDAKVIYTGNEQTEPGTYVVEAKVTFADGTITNLKSNLIIEKMESVLTADSVQEAIHNGDGAVPTFSLNNTEQQLLLNKIYTPGTHEIILSAPESAHYKESNKIKVAFNVGISNDLNIKFEPKSALVDGLVHKLEATNIPDGYHVEYENNTATTQGTYNAVCKVYDASNELKLTLNALLTLDNPVNAEFDKYLKEFFVDYLGNDYLSWNILTEDPESFGFVRDPEDTPKWYYYEAYDANYKQEAYEEMQGYYDLLKAFENAPLSYEQQVSYKSIESIMLENLEYYNPSNIYDPMVNLQYVDSFGGYAADFNTYIESYVFREQQDIDDCLSYVKSLPDSFATYVTYVSDRAKKGYPLSDYTIDEMISYLNDVVDQNEEYYLIDILVNKINDVQYLENSVKQEYVNQAKQYFKNYFMPAYETLANDLLQFKGKCEVTGYLAAYGEVGKAQYVYDLKTLLGMPDLNIEEYGAYLKEKVEFYADKLNSELNKVQSAGSAVYNKFTSFYSRGISVVGIQDPNEMLVYLKNFAQTLVPTLEVTPEITVKKMDDASAKVSNAVAYYMKSPLDGKGTEYITLNPVQLSTDYNSTISTMAHEGYPGHLYAWLYAKQLNIADVAKINSSTAHGEGWAQYVSLKLWEYMKTNNNFTSATDKKAVRNYCDFMYYNDLAAYIAYSYMDYGIHYEGWGIDKVASFMNGIGFNGDAAEELYLTLIEMPTTYAAYGYGMSYFVDLHKNTKATLTSKLYNEVEYNAALLSHGWCSLSELQKVSDQYIANTLFACNQIVE